MIDVAICFELPTRAEHPLKWCIVGGVIYDGGPLWCLAGAYCAGRVWHGRPRSEQAWDARAGWPEQHLMGHSLRSAKQPDCTWWRAVDAVQHGAMVGGRRRLALVTGCGLVWQWWSWAFAFWGWVFGDVAECRVKLGVDGRHTKNKENSWSHLFVKHSPSQPPFLISPPVLGGEDGGVV